MAVEAVRGASRRPARARDRAGGRHRSPAWRGRCEAAFGARCAIAARRVEARAVPNVARRAGGRASTWWWAPAPRCSRRCRSLGLIVVSRESHPALREDRAPYYHVRDVALARGRIAGATVVLSSMCPSSEAAALGLPQVTPTRPAMAPGRDREARVRRTRSAAACALSARRHARSCSRRLPGTGIAAVCRSCGRPAACAACGGMLRAEEGRVRCIVCEAPGRCKHCGAADFGLRRRRPRAGRGVGGPR